MNHEPVPRDVAAEILELHREGYGSNKIGQLTGVNSSTVKRIIAGKHQSFCNRLSTRQIQRFLTDFFGKPNSRLFT